MSMKSFIGVVLIASALPLSTAHAGGAGCGLGKVLLGGKSGMGENIAAAILNYFPIANVFFMSTAAATGKETLGCDPTKTVSNDIEREKFVASNLDGLSVDAAQGQGAYLASLADVMGIDEQDRGSFYRLTQERYDDLFAATTAQPETVIAALDGAMLEDVNLAKYVTQ